MATKSYSKHKEFREFSTSRNGAPYSSDEQFDIIKAELLPKNSKLHALTPASGSGGGGSDSEYFYEYHEDKHPSGKYEKKDLHTVEQYTVPAKSNAEHSSYFYKREDRSVPAVKPSYEYSTSSPGYSRIKSSKKDVSHNVEELDSLLDDLQKEQSRQITKNGYTSDTAESTGYEYRKTDRSTPVKSTPSSGYSTLKTEQRMEERSSDWRSSPLPAPKLAQSEFTKEMFREETNSNWRSTPVPQPKVLHSEFNEMYREEKSGNYRSTPVPQPKVLHSEFTNEMYREEKSESRVVPSQVSPALPQPVPTPVFHQRQFPSAAHPGGPMKKVTTTVKTYTYEVPADQDPVSHPIPQVTSQYVHDQSAQTTKTTKTVPASPSFPRVQPTTLSEHRVESASETEVFPRSERMVYPAAPNEVRSPPGNPNGPTTYKWSETSYSEFNTTERRPANEPAASLPFPRPNTPIAIEPTPKKLDDLLAEFPEARFPTQPDGVTQRKVEILRESRKEETKPSSNVAGPAVYYPPDHQPFLKKEEYAYGKASAEGGKWAAGRGMYEYESGSKSKEKSTEKKKVVPLCLPVCCAMPCSIM